MKARYFLYSDYLNAKLGTNPSYMWRSIYGAKEVVKQGCQRRIKNGESTRVWEVPWLPCLENGCLTTVMPPELKDIKVQSLMEDVKKNWDDEVLRDICNERDRGLIKRVPLPLRNREDSWFWLLDDKGVFTVKSCYRKL